MSNLHISGNGRQGFLKLPIPHSDGNTYNYLLKNWKPSEVSNVSEEMGEAGWAARSNFLAGYQLTGELALIGPADADDVTSVAVPVPERNAYFTKAIDDLPEGYDKWQVISVTPTGNFDKLTTYEFIAKTRVKPVTHTIV